jgi:hypothetical protein
MNWKFIFNSNLLGSGTHIDKAQKLAKESGYKFFTWNGEIKFIDGSNTGIMIEDCF